MNFSLLGWSPFSVSSLHLECSSLNAQIRVKCVSINYDINCLKVLGLIGDDECEVLKERINQIFDDPKLWMLCNPLIKHVQ